MLLAGVPVFLLLIASFTHHARAGSPTILFATNKDIRAADVSRLSKLTTIVKVKGDALREEGVNLDFYYEQGLVCWSDTALEMIQCVSTNGTHTHEPTTVVDSNLLYPEGLACDWYTGKLYWTDRENNRIEVVSIESKQRKVLFWTEIYQPRAIGLAPMKGFLFWTDWGEEPKIERASMDGDPNSRKVLVSEDISWPNGLTLDYDNELVYWIDGNYKFIAVMDYYGRNRRKILSKGLEYPFAITYMDQRLYWTDWRTWNIHSLELHPDLSEPRDIFHGKYVPRDIKVWDAKRQPPAPPGTPCRTHNGNCSHLCLLSSRSPGYSCACPTGVKLLDGHICAPGPQDLLLIVQRNQISKISLDSSDHTNFVIPLAGVGLATAIDFDPTEEMLYWTDNELHAIFRAYLNGSYQEDVVAMEVKNAEGIAVDWIARNLYWADSGTHRIEVAKIDGKFRKVLVHEDLGEPKALALALELGWMFWTDCDDKKPKIERSNLDGSERYVVVMKEIIKPTGIALDSVSKKIYWSDAKTNKIEVCNMNGSDRREIIAENLPELSGFSLLGDYLYWTDWQGRSIDRANKFTGGDREVVVEHIEFPDIMELKAIHRGKSNVTNPCAKNNGGCSQLCLNRPNNEFVCSCQIDYELAKDMKTCVEPEAFLLFTKKNKIGRTSIENANNNNMIPVNGIKDASAIDFEISDDRIYWTDIKLKTITRAFVNGSGIQTLVDFGLETPEGLAIDWIGHNLYWSDTGMRRIEVFHLISHSRRVLIWQNLVEPKSLALDPKRGFFYWTEWGTTGSIERAWMDGTHRQVILSNVGRTNGLTIDHSTYRLYWANLITPAINSYDLKTNKRGQIITQDVGYPFSITLYKDYIYWTDWNTGDIERANKTTGENRTKIHDELKSVTNLLLYHKSRQPGWNTCAVNNGDCTYLCIALPGTDDNSSESHKCACPTHFSLRADNKTCSAPKNFIVYSYRNGIGRFLPDTEDCPDIPLGVQNLKNVKVIEFDPISEYFYWIRVGDEQTTSIWKTSGKKTHSEIVLPDGKGDIFDLALDSLGRLLFWSCSMTDAISVMRLDSDLLLGVVVKGESEKPRNVAVHPEKRLLFWIDVGIMGVIQSLMDGNERIVIASDLKSLTSLTVDTSTDLVYWAHGRQIEFADIGGINRRVLVSASQGSFEHLSVLFDYVYWFDRGSQTVDRIDKNNGSGKKDVMSNRALTDLVTVRAPSNLAMASNVCSPLHELGGCSHICIGASANDTSGPSCSCPQSLVLSSDGKNCRVVPSCAPDQFTCLTSKFHADSKECISITWKCDGQEDCADGSDEIGCPCKKGNYFECHDGHCIDKSWVCDGISQCTNGEDEEDCCRLGQFRCTDSGKCISGAQLCDGWENCADGSDESMPVCISANNHREAIEPTLKFSESSYVMLVLVVIAVLSILALIIYWAKQRLGKTERLPDILRDSAGDPLSTDGYRIVDSRAHKSGRKDTKLGTAVRMSNINSSSISSSYDQSRATRFSYCASSSTNGSSVGGYPQETLNPPPSPTTTANSSSNVSRYRPYRNYRNVNQPPPPTPCTTDVCDESDYSIYSETPLFRYGHRAYGEPFSPPSTPRSVYQTDVPTSCPPSPSTRSTSTYVGPQPPPPSPVP